MVAILYEQPPKTGEGFVVWPEATLPNYQITSVNEYWRRVDTLRKARQRAHSGLEDTIENACELAKPTGMHVYVVEN